MREVLYARKQEESEGGENYRFTYYLLVEEVTGGKGLICENYGVKISSDDENGDQIAIENITMSFNKIEQLLKLLADNFVTPVSLPDILEDWL